MTLPAEPYRGPRPRLPRVKGGLLAATKTAWDVWWRSPMAHRWHPAQWCQLERLIALSDQLTRQLYRGEMSSPLAKEIRALEDGLGISEKGRRNLRWHLPEEEDPDAPVATVTALSFRQRPDPRLTAK